MLADCQVSQLGFKAARHSLLLLHNPWTLEQVSPGESDYPLIPHGNFWSTRNTDWGVSGQITVGMVRLPCVIDPPGSKSTFTWLYWIWTSGFRVGSKKEISRVDYLQRCQSKLACTGFGLSVQLPEVRMIAQSLLVTSFPFRLHYESWADWPGIRLV